MKQPIQLTNTIPTVRTSISRSLLRRGFLHIPLALTLAWLAVSPQARAICHQGCIPNNNTVLGDNALTLNASFSNTAIGAFALELNATYLNTATGYEALEFNTTGTENTANGVGALMFNRENSNYNTASGANAL